MNFPIAQGDLIMAPNLLPIKIINSNKIVNISQVLDTAILIISHV